MFNIGIIPETIEEQFETACQTVANLLDDPDWKWLKARIADEHLSWGSIMDLVAANI